MLKNLNVRTTIFLGIITLLSVVGTPLYIYYFGFQLHHLFLFGLMFSLTLMSITCGYHRLFSHRSYEAAWPVKLFFLTFGAASFQQSCLKWAAEHRVHHHYVDDPERDPYARTKGFWWSHMGWILSHTEPKAGRPQDLKDDSLVAWQHNNWIWLGSLAGFVFPAVLSQLIWNDFLGGLIFGGVLRLFVAHHCTWMINSLAHTIGSQPFSNENTARDHWLTAIFTFGEGYHNFHHWYARDYRNGIRAYHWDPGKWFIKALSWVGLTWNLRKVSEEAIIHAKAKLQLQKLSQKLDPSFVEQLNQHYEQLKSEIEAFAEEKKRWLEHKRVMSNAAWRAQKRQLKRSLAGAQENLATAYQEWQHACKQIRAQLEPLASH